ncbi:MAG TPA: TIGR03621 family F420-dependent LLM class oxidoreductase [Acidimicrobiia bacterium]|nr:TIGR03621 family F420-dependent LLM class oxidoreductase [Acidimicrobiia bacterium]
MPDETGNGFRTRPFRFGVTCEFVADRDQWRVFCRRVESIGCTNLLVSDHFGDQLALIPALGAAIDATTTLRVGALVACNDYRHPVMYAKELASLDVLSDGRVDWGIGAGWLASEYEMAGLAFDPPGVRVDRLREAVAVMKGCFGDQPVTFDGTHYRLHGLNGAPKPRQRPHPPLLIAGAGKRMLSIAAREADVIGIAPSITARRVGDRPPLQSVVESIDEQTSWIRAAAGDRCGEIELNMVAFPLAVTADAATAAARIAPAVGLTPDEALASPHIWIGSPDEIVASLELYRERWGISYWAVPAKALDRVLPVIERLASR